jgi:hypothetical protein
MAPGLGGDHDGGELLYPEVDAVTRANHVHACFMRIRLAYLSRKLLVGGGPSVGEMLEELSAHYPGSREQLKRLYEVYRGVKNTDPEDLRDKRNTKKI